MSIDVPLAPGVQADALAHLRGGVRLFDPLSGVLLRLPWLPDEIESGGSAQQWEQVNRPARSPLLLSRGRNLSTVSLPFRLIRADGGHVVDDLDRLNTLAGSSNPIRLDLAQQFRGVWRITGLSCRETGWDAQGRPVDVTVAMDLTAASDAVANVGPVRKKSKKTKRGGIKGRLKKAARHV